ncbi:NAD(P)H-dependent oxidoreductase [Nonomuraea sp. FMUSA5-5]|uniref:NAD(P)H-dependent oxidoreductase n=1 Tax=Nonomuraea composti TaxID=2720023 RepID=A0ABX1BBJ6_9ACTN|nr:NAD(P)H-dependent oxidoreductase [Nonomuraea sp. FMUSA5-5]NJP94202.1 NAD(P)H-dependent oxidoreductase [Nonomuraea sp. FMUSA5-5]
MTTTEPLHVAVIIGSTRAGRVCDTVGAWFTGHARRRDDLAVEVVDLAAYAFPACYPQRSTPSMREWADAVSGADAFVVVTPEYHRSFPASLKQAIDFAYDEWQAKPVGIVAYGSGSCGHYAVEQLRTVFTALHAVTMRDWVGLDLLGTGTDLLGVGIDPLGPGIDGASGRPLDTDDRLRAVAVLLDQLTWWGRTLRAGRRTQPYV